MKPAVGVLLLAAASVGACSPRVAAGDTILADVPAPEDYAAAVRDATRELRLYSDGLTTALLLRATRLDADFRREQEQERAHLYLLGPAERESALAASLAEADAAHVFVISADSQWRKELEFGFGDDTPWRLRLFVGDRPCTPESVTELEYGPVETKLYPHHNRWSELLSARFSADCGHAGPMVLQVTGPRGTGELGWRPETRE